MKHLLFILALASCYRTKNLAPPPQPPMVVPAGVSLDGEPAPGMSRVILDTVDGPALVENISGGSIAASGAGHFFGGSLELARRVCVTPCVLDAAPGSHELRFTSVSDPDRTSVGFVNLDTKPSAYRHALGAHRNTAWKGFVGWPMLLLGAVIDIGMVSAVSKSGDLDGGAITGAAVGLGLTALGGYLVYGSVVENQPGTGVQWHL